MHTTRTQTPATVGRAQSKQSHTTAWSRVSSSQSPVRAGKIGAIYDVVVSAGFATPWTASVVLGALSRIHDGLGLPGSEMPDFETSHLLFVTLFGIVVTMWSVVRILRPIPLLIAADTAGRAAFSLAFVWALAQGHSTVVIPFLVLELGFLVAQGLGVRKTLMAERKPTDMSTSTHPVRTPANLLFETTTGVTAPIADLVGPNGAVLFFMRTSTCPVCGRHLKVLSEMTSEISTSGRRLVIVIPDGIEAARKLGERYPTLQIVVGDAASDAQRDLGLGAKFGMQRSGVLIVDSAAVPVYEHAATNPMFALDKQELLEILR